MDDSLPQDTQSLLEKLLTFKRADERHEPPVHALKSVLKLGMALKEISDTEHVTTQRLFGFASATLHLASGEKRHLKACPECQEVLRDCRRWTRYVPASGQTDKAS